MVLGYRAVDAARAADVDRRQVEVFVARGLFTPSHDPGAGGTRLYSEDEIIRLAVMGEIIRFGVPANRSGEIVQRMHFRTDPSALVLYHGLLELVRSSQRGEPAARTGGPDAVYVRPEFPEPTPAWDVIPMADVMGFIDSGARTDRGVDVAAAIIVPLDRLIRRVQDRLAKMSGSEMPELGQS